MQGTNSINENRIAEVESVIRKDMLAINRGEKAAEHAAITGCEFLAELMTAYGLARAEWKELSSDELDTVQKVIDPILKRVILETAPKGTKARERATQLKSRLKGMAERGVTPKLTRLTLPTITVEVKDGKAIKATESEVTITIESESDWNQVSTSSTPTTSDGHQTITKRQSGSRAFAKNEPGKAKRYALDAKRAKSDMRDSILKKYPDAPGIRQSKEARERAVEEMPSLGAVLGGYLGHQGAANTINALAEAFKATPTGKHRETAMNILRKAQASLEALAHQQAEHISKAS